MLNKAMDCPFCGKYRKCNNGEGCDWCKEYEAWLDEVEENNV